MTESAHLGVGDRCRLLEPPRQLADDEQHVCVARAGDDPDTGRLDVQAAGAGDLRTGDDERRELA